VSNGEPDLSELRPNTVFYVFLLLLAAAGVAVYLLFFLSHVPGATEERLGEYEPLPEGLGVWRVDEEGPSGRAARAEGLVREERLLLQEGGRRFIKQVRYRSAETREIVRIEPEELIPRRRARSGDGNRPGGTSS
jgi:hypothetical protein